MTILLQRTHDQHQRVRLVIHHQDVKAQLGDGRRERVRGDIRLQWEVRLEDDLAAFVRAEDLESGPAFQGQRARLALNVRDEGIIVRRIVVGQRETAHARRGGDLHRVVVAAVSPILL